MTVAGTWTYRYVDDVVFAAPSGNLKAGVIGIVLAVRLPRDQMILVLTHRGPVWSRSTQWRRC